VALLWTRSNTSMSFLFWGLQSWTQDSRWGPLCHKFTHHIFGWNADLHLTEKAGQPSVRPCPHSTAVGLGLGWLVVAKVTHHCLKSKALLPLQLYKALLAASHLVPAQPQQDLTLCCLEQQAGDLRHPSCPSYSTWLESQVHGHPSAACTLVLRGILGLWSLVWASPKWRVPKEQVPPWSWWNLTSQCLGKTWL